MNELILVVDDEPRIVKQARDYLERNGFRVTDAADGKHALVLARHERPDLIVLDLNSVSYTHLRAHETVLDLVCRLLLEKKNKQQKKQKKKNKQKNKKKSK